MAEETRTAINEQVTQIGDNLAQPVPVTNFATPSIVGAPQPAQVYGAANVAQATTAPIAKPDMSDPFGVRDYYLNSPEIKAARAEAQRVQEAINASRQGLRTTTTALQNQNDQAMGGTGASINLIGRQVGRARDLTSNELAALSENQQATISYLDTLTQDAQGKYAIAEEQRSQIQDLIRQTGGKAGIAYTDSYEQAIKKADTYITEKAKQEAKDKYKAELKSQLQALGKSTKGLSRKELEKKLKKYNKSALAEAKAREDQEWQMKVATFDKSMRSGGGSPDSVPYYTVDPTTGEVKQGFNDDGTPMMIPKGAQMQKLEADPNVGLLEALSGGAQPEQNWWDKTKSFFTNLW